MSFCGLTAHFSLSLNNAIGWMCHTLLLHSPALLKDIWRAPSLGITNFITLPGGEGDGSECHGLRAGTLVSDSMAPDSAALYGILESYFNSSED